MKRAICGKMSEPGQVLLHLPALTKSHALKEHGIMADAQLTTIAPACLFCGGPIEGARAVSPRKWCTRKCRMRYQNGYPKTRECLVCGNPFQILVQRDDANKKYCSYKCSKKANGRLVKKWTGDHPDAMKRYNRTRIEKAMTYLAHQGILTEQADP